MAQTLHLSFQRYHIIILVQVIIKSSDSSTWTFGFMPSFYCFLLTLHLLFIWMKCVWVGVHFKSRSDSYSYLICIFLPFKSRKIEYYHKSSNPASEKISFWNILVVMWDPLFTANFWEITKHNMLNQFLYPTITNLSKCRISKSWSILSLKRTWLSDKSPKYVLKECPSYLCCSIFVWQVVPKFVFVLVIL